MNARVIETIKAADESCEGYFGSRKCEGRYNLIYKCNGLE